MIEQLHQQLPNVYIFRLVAELGSFQAAANQLGLPRSSVSKKIAQLESYLQQRLLQRSTRQLRLTEDGLALLQTTAGLAQLIDSTKSLLMAKQAEPVGTVSVSTSSLIGQLCLLPMINDLRRVLPQVTLNIKLEDNVVDLLSSGVDIAIRTGELPDSSLVAKRIATKRLGCFASPSYLARCGMPQAPSDLLSHHCVVFSNNKGSMTNWRFEQRDGSIQTVALKPSVTVNSGRTVLDLAAQGVGIVRVAIDSVQHELANGQLVPVLSDWPCPERLPLHLVCLGHHTRSRAVDAVWRYLGEHLVLDDDAT
uniref:LysR family transcriptional regulator n=1 Tax=Thaumasiovibrio occultus TaxID=1891184 RepID=UPI00192CF475|nr:LysR family transcriptional regulator [Thaumasiovibrio occultus]